MESKFPGDIMHIFTLNPQRLQRAAIKEEYCLQKKNKNNNNNKIRTDGLTNGRTIEYI